MITDCTGMRQWDLSDTETIFVQGVFALLKFLIAVAICVYIWRVSQTERAHQRTSVLGLEEPTFQPEVSANRTEEFLGQKLRQRFF